ncbi:MAG: SMC family ATPase, partial [Acidobacteria bacterium]|nr:SMC family ATPase [Acidobacteriota bacterium]
MRPLHLAIEGLRSFRSPVSIDFAGRDHVAIVGDTGAGKSSILEAVTYALYGQTTFTAQANQELMNDTSLHLRVVLRFRVSGETWEVARTLRRDGQGRVGSPNAQLRRLGADGEAVEQVEQVKPVNDGVKALIGLDSDAFLRTVVLPQGRFARLLVEDRPTDRGRILRQVWRTDELEAAGALAGAARHEAERLRERLAQAASGYPDDPAAHLAALQAARETAGRDADAATEDERAAAAAHEALLSAATARREASGVTERLGARDVEGVAGVLAPIAAAERRIAGEEAAHEQRQAG